MKKRRQVNLIKKITKELLSLEPNELEKELNEPIVFHIPQCFIDSMEQTNTGLPVKYKESKNFTEKKKITILST